MSYQVPTSVSRTEIPVTKHLPSRAVVQGGRGGDLTDLGRPGRLQAAASGREVVSFALASQV